MKRAHAAIAWLALSAGIAAPVGCGDDSESSITIPPGPPVTSGAVPEGSTTTVDATTGELECACAVDCTCPTDQVCAAGFSVGDSVPPDEEFTCHAACIPTGAVSLWCHDDSSCCEGTCNPDDGLCVSDSSDASGPGTGSSGSDSGSGSGSGSGGSSSDSGSSSSGSSDSGSSSGSTE